MAYEIPGQLVTLAASTDLSTHQFKFVVNLSDHRAALPAASTLGNSIFGVLQNKPVEDEAATIMVSGISKVRATASTLSQGDLCAASSAGFAVPAVAGDYVVGRVMHGSSGGANRVLTVLIQPVGTT